MISASAYGPAWNVIPVGRLSGVNPAGTVIAGTYTRKVFNVGTPLVSTYAGGFVASLSSSGVAVSGSGINTGWCSTDLYTIASRLWSAITVRMLTMSASR